MCYVLEDTDTKIIIIIMGINSCTLSHPKSWMGFFSVKSRCVFFKVTECHYLDFKASHFTKHHMLVYEIDISLIQMHS